MNLFQHFEKLAAVAAVALAVGLGLGYGGSQPKTPDVPTPPAQVASFEPSPLRPAEFATGRWEAPAPQKSGSDWLFEVFTPPVIYFDGAQRRFITTPPRLTGESAVPRSAFAVELAGIERDPYRLQLVGYVGEPGSYLVSFEDVSASDSFILRPGNRRDSAAVTLRAFRVDQVRTERPGQTTTVEFKAVATILDERTGEEIELVSTERRFLPNPRARFRLRDQPANEVVLRAGETYPVGESTYRLVRLEVNPPRAVVERLAADGTVEESATLEVTLPPVAPAVETSLETAPDGFPSGFPRP